MESTPVVLIWTDNKTKFIVKTLDGRKLHQSGKFKDKHNALVRLTSLFSKNNWCVKREGIR